MSFPNHNTLVQIQDLRPGELPALGSLYTSIYPKRPLSPNQIKSRLQQILQSNGRIWTITQSTKPVGYAAIYPVPGLPGLVEIEGGITPAKQRRGLASQLLQHIITTLKSSDLQQLSCSVPNLNTPAARFLQHHHFFVEHEELHLQLTNLQTRHLPPATCHLPLVDQQTAVSTFSNLYDQSFAGSRWYQPFSPGEIAATLSPVDEMLFCLHNDTPIGFAWVRYPNQVTAEIEPVGIVKAWQGKGYGRSFLNTVLLRLQKQNIQQVHLGVWADNHVARHLYDDLGFRHQSTTTYLGYNL